ncbi:MAG: hypothetical protein C0463_05900 [Idiomarina sp.]|nr:hypothetical protein [Idiomarina sp.]
MTFDKPDSESPFLTFVANEFRKRGTELRSQLSNKTYVKTLLDKTPFNGETIAMANELAVVDDVEDITAEKLGQRAVLKPASGWSSRGVMLLEKASDDTYFDYMSLRERKLAAIRKRQIEVANSFKSQEPKWIIEEFLESPQPGAIPFDYKFYMFQDQIGLVVQIDRNTSPPKFTLFDGNFQPMVEGLDYKLTGKNAQHGTLVLPRSVTKLSAWAIHLAQQTDAPFVSVDLYDTNSGPAFGEFTFSPGATHKRIFSYSTDVIERFDVLFKRAEAKLRGESVEQIESFSSSIQKLSKDEIDSMAPVGLDKYKALAAHISNNGTRGAMRFQEIYEGRLKGMTEGPKRLVYNYYLNAWSKIRSISKA